MGEGGAGGRDKMGDPSASAMTKEVVTMEGGSFGDLVGDIQGSFIWAPSQVVGFSLTSPAVFF